MSNQVQEKNLALALALGFFTGPFSFFYHSLKIGCVAVGIYGMTLLSTLLVPPLAIITVPFLLFGVPICLGLNFWLTKKHNESITQNSQGAIEQPVQQQAIQKAA